MGNRNSGFREVSHDKPCPVCGGTSWCSVSCDGTICICRRSSGRRGECRNGYRFRSAKRDKNGDSYGVWGSTRHKRGWRPSRSGELKEEIPIAPPEMRDKSYSTLLHELELGLDDDLTLEFTYGLQKAEARGYRSFHPQRQSWAIRAVEDMILGGGDRYSPEARLVLDAHMVRVPGFVKRGKYWRLNAGRGILIPVRDHEGRIIALAVRVPDNERAAKDKKYYWLSSKSTGGPGPECPVHWPLHDGNVQTVRVTEGILKADATTAMSGMLTLGLPGLFGWDQIVEPLQERGTTTVQVAFDSDSRSNCQVARAFRSCVQDLREHFNVQPLVWDPAKGKGIDDLLRAGHKPRIIGKTESHDG